MKTIHNSFISSNVSYCPLVWHFFGKVNNEKIEKIQERSLRILQNDYTSSYHDMLRIAEMTPALIYRLRVLTLEVFKSLQKSNPPCLHDLFEINKTEYLMRNPMRLIQPKRSTTNYYIYFTFHFIVHIVYILHICFYFFPCTYIYVVY